MSREVSGIMLALLLSCILTLMLNTPSAEAWHWRINLERKEDFLVYTSTIDHTIGLNGSEIGYELVAGDKIGVAWWATETPTLLPPIVYLLNQDQYDHWNRFLFGPTHGYLFKKVDWGETSFTYDITSSGKYYVVIDNPNWAPLQIIGPTIHFIYYEAVYWPQHYYLTVYSPYGTPSGEGLYDRGETAYASLDTGIVDHGNRTRRVFTNWGGDASGTYYAQSNPIIMDTDKTAIANWKTQYYLTVASVFGTTGGEGWYDIGSTAYATLDAGVINYGNGTCRVFTSWSGDTSGTNYAQSNPITINGPKTANANWKTQYLLTVRTNGLGTKTTNVYNGTNILGTATDATPFTGWFDQGTAIQLNIDSPISGSPTQYVFTQWTGDASGSGRPVSVTMNAPKDIRANYKTQHEVTFTHTGLDSSATGTVVTVDGGPKKYGDLPYNFWVDNGTVIAYSYSNVSSTTPGKRFILTGVTGPTSPITVTGPVTVTGNYKTQYYLTVRTNPLGLVTISGEGWYNASKSVSLSAPSVSGYTFLNWNVDGASQGSGVSSITVNMNAPHTATAHYAIIPPSLSVSISPLSASILVGQSTTFTSTVSGGTSPYKYQWYLNGNLVSGATSSTWTFTPTTSGIYYVYLQIKDANNNTAQSETARVVVSGVSFGGYSVSLTKPVAKTPLICYSMLLAIFSAMLILFKRKRK